jgi:hypothetical protein
MCRRRSIEAGRGCAAGEAFHCNQGEIINIGGYIHYPWYCHKRSMASRVYSILGIEAGRCRLADTRCYIRYYIILDLYS